MPFPIRYSTRAYLEYEAIIESVLNKFGHSSAAKVDAYFEEVLKNISINPFLYPVSNKKKNIRRCVLSHQTTLYYRFKAEDIKVIK